MCRYREPQRTDYRGYKRDGEWWQGLRRCVLGIDSGASKIEVSLIDLASGLVRTETIQRPGNPASIGIERFSENIVYSIDTVLREKDCLVYGVGIGLAGYLGGLWDERIRSLFSERYGVSREMVVVFEDIETAHVSVHLLGDGVVAILGTGSNFYGRCRDRVHRVGGWGHLIDDRGGAYSIGARGLSYVVKALDGRTGYTRLVDYAFSLYRVSGVEELVSVIYSSTDPKSLIASFAPMVFRAAREGDACALRVVEEEVEEVVLAISTVYRRLGCPEAPLGVVGSLYRENRDVLKKMIEEGVSREVGRPVEVLDPRVRQSCASALVFLRERGLLEKSLFEKIVEGCRA